VEMSKELGCAAVSITHDMASARKISDEIAMLYQGKIIWRGPSADVDHSGDARVDQFVHGRAEGPIQAVV
ncbi:MAG: ABC transporter ATP-binding protein, partial [Hyphomonadaceae bacterium]